MSSPEAASNPPTPPSSGRVIGCFLLLIIGLHLAAAPFARFTSWRVDAEANPGLAEAISWKAGRLDLPRRLHDTALVEGRVYNVFPPLFTMTSWLAITAGPWLGVPEGQFYPPWYVALVALPLPIAGYWAFLTASRKPAWAAFFTAAWILGTPILPALVAARDGGINHINHLFSQTGLMLIAASLLGHRSIALGLVGLVIAAWSRQTCILFALPLAWAAFHWEARLRAWRVAALGLTMVVILIVPMVISKAKFGSALDSGYQYLYEGRSDELAEAGRRHFFSPEFVARNARYMHFELPAWEFGQYGVRPAVSPYGASIWFTMPILGFIIIDARRWWREPLHRWIMLASLGIVAALLLFHNTGYIQPGYYRFSLDFIPLWLVLIASWEVSEGWRRRMTIGALAWSMLYFNLVTELYA